MAVLSLVVGLGNPGAEYAKTRHNAGFWVLDRLAQVMGLAFRQPFLRSWAQASCSIADLASIADGIVTKQGGRWSPGFPAPVTGDLLLIKPLTYMNRSGDIIDAAIRPWSNKGFEPSLPLVAVDQMDLPPGDIRIKARGGTAGHNGLKSIHAALSDRFIPVYVGIGRPDPGQTVIDHVLGEPSDEDYSAISACLDRALAASVMAILGDLEGAMALANRKSREP